MGLVTPFCSAAERGYKTTEAFEQAWGKKLGQDVVAVSSGYTALLLALKALGVKPGDEVIVPDFTMVATANAVIEAGAVPVFTDVGLDGNIRPQDVEEALTEKTVGIIVVHIYGLPADVAGIRAVAKGRWILEDAAEAHGAKVQERNVGTLGDVAAFSHYHNKFISTGEGGSVTSNRKGLLEQVRSLRSYCFGKGYQHDGLGYGFRMNPYGAEHGIEDVKNLEVNLKMREYVAFMYDHGLNAVLKPKKQEGRVYWMYGIRSPKKIEIEQRLRRVGIPTRDFFKPMRAQKHIEGEPGKNAMKLWREGILLPILDMNDLYIDRVIKAVNGD